MDKEFVKLSYSYTEGYFDGDYWTPDIKPWNEDIVFIGYFTNAKSAKDYARKRVMEDVSLDGGNDRLKQVFFKENDNRAYYRYRFLRKDGSFGKQGWNYHFIIEHCRFMDK